MKEVSFLRKSRETHFVNFKRFFYFFIFPSGFNDNAAVNAEVWSFPDGVGGVGWIQGIKMLPYFFYIVRYNKHYSHMRVNIIYSNMSGFTI